MRHGSLGDARGHGQRRLFQNAENLGHADTPDAVAFEELFNLRGAQAQRIGRCWGRFPQLQKPFLREIAVNLKHLLRARTGP